MTRIKPLMFLGAAVIALSACGSAQPGISSDKTPSISHPTTASSKQKIAGETKKKENHQRAVVTVEKLEVFSEPNGSTIATLDSSTAFGSARVLLATGVEGEWVEVLLPERPNGRVGWVHKTDIRLEPVDYYVEVNLTERSLLVTSGDEEILHTTVAIGTPENPTPTGLFYVTDKLETHEASGAYGPFALGLSAYSETLTEFGSGDGQVGIHGTNQPNKLGEAASHGCVRLSNKEITDLAEILPLGTPVFVS